MRRLSPHKPFPPSFAKGAKEGWGNPSPFAISQILGDGCAFSRLATIRFGQAAFYHGADFLHQFFT